MQSKPNTDELVACPRNGQDQIPADHHDLAVGRYHRARGRVRAGRADARSITRSTSRIISPSSRGRRADSFPIVRQYRPALEAFTWELPAGLAEPDEDLAEGCRRELLEETGYPTRAIHPLGTAAPCSGRLSNRIHSFFLETGERVADFVPEPGLTVELVTPSELVDMIKSGEFVSQLHLGALLLAELRSFIVLR